MTTTTTMIMRIMTTTTILKDAVNIIGAIFERHGLPIFVSYLFSSSFVSIYLFTLADVVAQGQRLPFIYFAIW